MKATAEVHAWCSPFLLCMQLKVLGQPLGGKGNRPSSVQPPGLKDAGNNPQRIKDFSFQPLKHCAIGNKSTASLENILMSKMLNLSIVHCSLVAFKQVLYKCFSLPSFLIGDAL